MKSNGDEFNREGLGKETSPNESLDKFILLSAYLDGEATPSECKLVQHWLDTDPSIKATYLQLKQLHHGIEQIPLPYPGKSPQVLTDAVFRQIDQQNQQRRLLWGSGIAIAALLSALLSNLVVKPILSPQMSHYPVRTSQKAEALMIALNQPIIDLPTEGQSSAK